MTRIICFFTSHKWEYFSNVLTSGRRIKLKHCTHCGSVKKAKMIEYIIGIARQSAGTPADPNPGPNTNTSISI